MILDDILELVKSDPIDEQIKKICDKIIEEEIGDIECQEKYTGPKGPNMVLSLKAIEFQGNEIFVCLEREAYGKYIVSEWRRSSKKGSPLKRVKSNIVPSSKKAKTILKVFGTTYKFVKGE